MAHEADEQEKARPVGRKRRWARNVFRLLLLLFVLALVAAWLQRERIADSFIADTFAENDIRATYDIDSIGPQRQVLSNIVIGDPDRPDLTIERLELSVTPRFGLPEVTRLVLVRPRIFGAMRGGSLSFGDLDALLFSGDGAEPTEFPNMVLEIEDGRGLIETGNGRVGLMLSGGGHLRGGFSAELAAVGEDVGTASCGVEAPTLYGRLSIDAERPHFVGPLRFSELACEDSGLALGNGTLQLDVFAERNLVDLEGQYDLALEDAQMADAGAQALDAAGRFTWRDSTLNALYDVTASDVSTSAARAGELTVEGRLRALDQFARVEVEGELSGSALAIGAGIDEQLTTATEATQGTLAAVLLDKLQANLGRELAGSTVAGNFDARLFGERMSVIIPEARLRGGSGATLLALSRTQFAVEEDGNPSFSGNLQTGGPGLPFISGRMEQGANGAIELRMAMREYASGDARLSIPRLAILQGQGGRMAIEGQVQASGPLPGGFAEGLRVPVDGTIATDGSIALWSGCRDVAFDRLTVSSLSLDRQSLTLCPPSGRSILRFDNAGLQINAGTNSLDLRGELAETPIRIASGPIGFAYPGTVAARDLDITLGPEANAQRFVITDLQADLSAENIGGEFAGADIFLASVPLDVMQASGSWVYVDSRLVLDDIAFTLEDREEMPRFEPLMARGAQLVLFDNLVTADALLRHPASGADVSRVHIEHDLGSSAGHADLFVDGLTFGPALQPAPDYSYCDPARRPAGPVSSSGLTCMALGVVSDVSGTVTGQGRIDWNSDAVTSSGSFSSDSLDLAAAFGPVQGASGTVVFTDLLGLTTAPDQRIAIDAINPGIEVYDGEVGFQLVNGERVEVTGGSWPFMGGTLSMRPVTINIGVEEFRTYVMVIEGLEAARFVERMELGNLAANGVFDGTIPIVFDPDGNGRLVEGILTSREPGGNVSYVGDLSYEDMGFFANYAFRTLRDLQYDRMEIAMNGPLTGELVTQVRFEGIQQGPMAERNFVSRAIADLPIELRVNIRAPFYQLMTSLRAMYDPAAIRDPRSIGLLSSDGERLREAVDQETVDEQDARAAEEEQGAPIDSLNEQEPDIQPPESEAMR